MSEIDGEYRSRLVLVRGVMKGVSACIEGSEVSFKSLMVTLSISVHSTLRVDVPPVNTSLYIHDIRENSQIMLGGRKTNFSYLTVVLSMKLVLFFQDTCPYTNFTVYRRFMRTRILDFSNLAYLSSKICLSC